MNLIKSLVIGALSLGIVHSANWAQLAGPRAQNTAHPYTPQEIYRNASEAIRPMWTPRWGHAVVVYNQTYPLNHLSPEENSERTKSIQPKIILLGGDDHSLDRFAHLFPGDNEHFQAAGGKLRNDVWVSNHPVGEKAGWNMDKRFDQEKDEVDSDVVQSQMTWYESNAGKVPPATWPSGPKHGEPMTYDDWISCQEYFRDTLPDPSICNTPNPICYIDITSPGCEPEGVWKKDNMWSPRRGHSAVVAGGKLYVIGGRAQEYAPIDDARLIGGIQDRKIETISDHPTIREEIILKNDIWVSEDGLGKHWRLVTPGCKDPQEDVLIQTEVWSRNRNDPFLSKNVGSLGSQCTKTTDCYGQAKCMATEGNSKKVCVCPMFSVREHHSVSVQHTYFIDDFGKTFSEDYMYLVGGFTTVRQSFCSNKSCGSMNSYRLAMDDAWVSNNGVSWVQFKAAFTSRSSFRGRGAHASILIHANYFKNRTESSDRLWIFGGETSNPEEPEIEYLDDVWYVGLPKEPCCLSNGDCFSDSHPLKVSDIGVCLPGSFDWQKRASSSKWSGRSGHVVLYEPASALSAFKEQICLHGGKNKNGVQDDVWTWDLTENGPWRRDFESDQWYRIVDEGELSFGSGLNNSSSEASLSPYKYYYSEDENITSLRRVFLPIPDEHLSTENSHLKNTPLISSQEVQIMRDVGIHTIRDLVDADLYTILKLRGFDYPWEEKRIVNNICYLRALVTSFIEKCKVRFSHLNEEDKGEELCKDGACNLEEWDGCLPLEGHETVDVHGLGDVTVPHQKHDPERDLEEMHCRQTPGKRYMAAGVSVDSKIMVMGGQGNDASSLYRDVWARDDSFPETRIITRPETYTHDTMFSFESNEPGAKLFEYKVVDVVERIDIIPWVTTTGNYGVDVSWLDDKKGGPGRGFYGLYARAIDPSGNRDFRYSTKTNVHVWMYIPPPPWEVIFGIIILFFSCVVLLYFEYRRRSKKKALERYAIRRMRRKYKLQTKIEEGNGDWKESYLKKDKKLKSKEKRQTTKTSDRGKDEKQKQKMQEKSQKMKDKDRARKSSSRRAKEEDSLLKRRRTHRKHDESDQENGRLSKSRDHYGKTKSRREQRRNRRSKSRHTKRTTVE